MDRQRLADSINPEMIILGRLSRGYTQGELAGVLGITQGHLSKLESGLIATSPDTLMSLSAVLRYPVGFFCRVDPIVGPGVSELFHRKRQNVPARVLGKIHARMNVYRMNLSVLLQSAEIDDHRIPFLDIEVSQLSPEETAQRVRALWNLPPGPIPSVVRAIEGHGGIIVPFSFETLEVDAISQYLPGLPPLFFVNDDLATAKDRLRFSLCHELGHLVMHQFLAGEFVDVERQADQFASEFLLPRRDISHELDGLTLAKLAALKQRWKVSMSALITRAKDLNRISERQARSLWTQLAKLGYTRKREPAELAVQEDDPTLLQDLLEAHLRELGYTSEQLAQLLTLDERDLQTDYLMHKRRLRIVG